MAKSRRPNGSGNIRKLPSGNWCAKVMVGYHDDGTRAIRSLTAPTRSEVVRMVEDLQLQTYDEKQRNLLDHKKGPQFSQWADLWYTDYATQVRPSTYAGYRYTLKILKEYFGTRRLGTIRALDINTFLDDLVEREYSQSAVSKCKAMLVQIFAAAESNDLILKNPAARSKAVRNIEFQTAKDAFTPEEVSRLMEDLPHDLMGNSIRVLLGSGLRVQELLALTREDIAEDGSTITVNKAIQMVDSKPRMGPPKSRRGDRCVPISADFQPFARYIRSHGGNDHIWHSDRRENHLYSVSTFRDNYYKLLQQIPDVRQLSPHCCRHTYVTQLEAAGIQLEVIARLAGHSSITTTDVYTHTSLHTLQSAVAVLDRKTDNTNTSAAV